MNEALIKESAVKSSNFSKRFFIKTDASNTGTGGNLAELDDEGIFRSAVRENGSDEEDNHSKRQMFAEVVKVAGCHNKLRYQRTLEMFKMLQNEQVEIKLTLEIVTFARSRQLCGNAEFRVIEDE